MAGNSSSSMADLRDRNTNDSDTYDLQNWQGLTAVLKMGKDALPDAGEYGAFRNLVLQYAQRGGDVELKKKIIEAISRFGKPQETAVAAEVPLATPDPIPPQKNTSDFLPHTVVESSEHEVSGEGTVTPLGTSVKSPQATRRLLPRFSTVSMEETQSTSGVSEVESQVPISVTIEPVTEEEKIVLSPVAEDIVLSAVTATTSDSEVEQETPRATQHSIEDHKARITEIKHAVHTHFGNPAALVDMRSDTGKNYMKALLMALKATGPGSDADADTAMRELESVYAKLIAESKTHAPIPEIREVPVQVVVPSPTFAPIPEPTAEVVIPNGIPVQESEPTSTEVPVEEFIASEISPEVEEFSEEVVAEDVDLPNEIAVEQKAESKFSAKNTLAQLSSRRNEYIPQAPQYESQSALHNTNNTTQVRNVISQNKHTLRGLGKVAEDNTGRQSAPLPQDVVVKQSELVSEEITSALRTLLHDWSLFAGSGLFGTGPSGIEHPLYQQLAPLSMGEVIAGRWEHSDPKVTKTIKEYVDAWRHEQGIAFTTNETFEHYLRRVIQRILKRQIV